MAILIESDETASNTEFHINVMNEPLSDGVWFNYSEDNATISSPQANRWYYGWAWDDGMGAQG